MAKDAKKISNEIPSPGEIDKIVHEPGRLSILSHLYVVEEADFIFIKNQTGMTWGNLSSHISKLEEVGYVDVKKEFKGKKPLTMLKLSEKGRKAFEEYKNVISGFLK